MSSNAIEMECTFANMQDTGVQNMNELPAIGILAGGKSRRMGQNKAFLPVRGEPMLQRLLQVFRDYPEVMISAAAVGLYEDCGRPVIYDEKQGIGPIEGICRILEHTSRSHVFFCAVDMPFVTAELVSCLMKKVSGETDCVCLTEEGRIHPLCAVYSKSASSFLHRRKDEGCHRLTELVQEMRTCFVPLEESGLPLNSAENINDPDDYRKLCGPFVFCVSGIKNSGKTSLIEQLIPYFSEDGLRVGVIKHDGHDFDIDHEGTDSDRFSRAGAAVSAICSGSKYAVVAHKPPKIEELLAHCTDLDIVIIEGMKYSDWPKVEVVRKENGNLPVCQPDTWICLASDYPLPEEYRNIPWYDLNDIRGIYQCIHRYIRDLLKLSVEGIRNTDGDKPME